MIESEYKYRLNMNHYDIILGKLTDKYVPKRNIQINYYYDNKDFELNKTNVTLRVRQIDETLKLEIKLPLYNNGAIKVKKEMSRPLCELPSKFNFSKDEWHSILPENTDFLLVGEMITERIRFFEENGIEIDLDKNYYLGLIDYELEIEFPEELKMQASEIVHSLIQGEDCKPSEHGKNERFFCQFRKLFSCHQA